jgi:hypothetical protein
MQRNKPTVLGKQLHNTLQDGFGESVRVPTLRIQKPEYVKVLLSPMLLKCELRSVTIMLNKLGGDLRNGIKIHQEAGSATQLSLTMYLDI